MRPFGFPLFPAQRNERLFWFFFLHEYRIIIIPGYNGCVFSHYFETSFQWRLFDFMKLSGLIFSLNLILMGNFNKTKYLHFNSHC